MPDTDALALQRSRRLVLGEILARNARKHPGKTALVFEGRSLTFGELDERVNRLANGLAARGVAAGAHVAALMYNRLEVIESYLACHKLGACPVPVNFRLALDEVRYILQDSEAVAVLCDDTLEPLAVEAAQGGLVVSTSSQPAAGAVNYDEVLAASSPEAPDAVVAEDDLAFLMYTSGTTGRPKGAMLTHRNLVTNTSNWILEMEAGTEDVWLSGLPLFHIGGINGILPFLYTGGTSIVTPSTNFDPQQSLDLLAEHGATMCYFVPTQWQQICSLPGIDTVDTSRLRKALWGASQAPRSTLELLTATFPSVGIVNAFGQTEMSSNTCFLKPADAVRKMGSVGRPAVNVEARIVDDEMNDVAVGEVGEIVYRGPTVMKGYWRNEAATAEAFAGGWFHSGDLVTCDEEGFITVVDRKKDMIISGGENIYPAEVEAVLMQHDAVADVTVVGVAHPKWVETPVAIVVLAEGHEATEAELIEFTRSRLASYKKPTAVRFVEVLPRNAAGKVLRRELRDTHADIFSGAPA
jgi:acyl-CoA synthetase (AMP-forming)/AMP-acid ligase II